MQSTALLAALTFGLVGILLVLLRHRFRHRKLFRFRLRKPGTGGMLEHTCENCHHPLVIPMAELSPLSPPEKGLAVRGKPAWVKHRLAEYDCPYCETSHCFATDVRPPRWLGMDLYAPSKAGRCCRECGKALVMPRWSRGAYDGKMEDAPGALEDVALVCPHCNSPVCVPCCRSYTRNRTEDRSLLCPRCGRGPLTKFFHGSAMS